MPTAYSYVRFSTPEQAEGDSLRRQVEKSEAYAKEHGLTLDTKLNLRDLGVSAFRGKNLSAAGALGKFLALVKAGKIESDSVLLVENIDRLSRQNPYQTITQVLPEILANGLRIAVLDLKIELSERKLEAEPHLMHLLLAVASRSHEESKTKSERVSDTYSSRRKKLAAGEKPLMGKRPGHIDLIDGEMVLNPERVAVLKRMIAMMLEGKGSSKIAAALNREKVSAWGDKDVEFWSPVTVHHILTSKVLIGEIHPRNVANPIKDYYPSIISEADFYKMQSLVESRRRVRGPGRTGKHVANIFGPLLVHGVDGGRMILTEKKGYKSLISGTAVRGMATFQGFPYVPLEAAFLKFVVQVQLDEPEAPASNLDVLQGKLADLDKRRAKLRASLSSGGDFESGLEMLRDFDAQAKLLKQKIEKERMAIHRPATGLKDLKKLAKQIEMADGEELFAFRTRLKNALGSVVKQIKLHIHTKTNVGKIAVAEVEFLDGNRESFSVAAGRYFGKCAVVSAGGVSTDTMPDALEMALVDFEKGKTEGTNRFENEDGHGTTEILDLSEAIAAL